MFSVDIKRRLTHHNPSRLVEASTGLYPDEANEVRYTVVFHRTDEGISVSVPGLPGCWSEGDTEAEALENIRDAVQEYLAATKELTQGQEQYEIEIAA